VNRPELPLNVLLQIFAGPEPNAAELRPDVELLLIVLLNSLRSIRARAQCLLVFTSACGYRTQPWVQRLAVVNYFAEGNCSSPVSAAWWENRTVKPAARLRADWSSRRRIPAWWPGK
jgi:hypothetical protein